MASGGKGDNDKVEDDEEEREDRGRTACWRVWRSAIIWANWRPSAIVALVDRYAQDVNSWNLGLVVWLKITEMMLLDVGRA
jgi:hypothetical protein